MVLPDGDDQAADDARRPRDRVHRRAGGPARRCRARCRRAPPTRTPPSCPSTRPSPPAPPRSASTSRSSTTSTTSSDFPVGGIVPTGYYDRTDGEWKAAPNGRVIKLLAVVDGKAQIDTDGDGPADTGLGIDDAERARLAAHPPRRRRAVARPDEPLHAVGPQLALRARRRRRPPNRARAARRRPGQPQARANATRRARSSAARARPCPRS